MSNLTVYSIAKSTETPDGLKDYHVMLARGVVAEAHGTATRLSANIAETLITEESLWDIWTRAIETYETRYDPTKGKPPTYGHYAVRHAISTVLRIVLKARRGSQGHCSIRLKVCPRCATPRMYSKEVDAVRIRVLSTLRITCPDCGLIYAPVGYPDGGFLSLEGSHSATSWDENDQAEYGRGRETIHMERDSDTGRIVQGSYDTRQPLDDLILKDRNEIIAKALASLPPRIERIMRARFFDRADLATIAAQEGMTHQRVDQIVKKTIKTLAYSLAKLAPGA